MKTGLATSCMTTLLTAMVFMCPPSTISSAIPESRVSRITQLLTAMFRNPPVDSVPHLKALDLLLSTQLVTATSWQGRGEVLFRTMQSSPVSIQQLEMRTPLQLSTSTPSLFRLTSRLSTVIPSMVTFSQAR